MGKIISQLRTNERFYTYALVGTVVCLILSVIVMAFSRTLSIWLVGFFFTLTVNLYYFLGVNPYFKGMVFSILPVLISVVILELITYLPIPEKWEWLLEGNSRGRGGATEAVFALFLFLVIKITGVKPFKHSIDE